MSFFPNKFLFNILASGLILSCPLTVATAASNTMSEQSTKTETKTEKKTTVQKKETQLSWQNYSFPDNGFSIDFPKKPEQVHQTIDIPKSDLKIAYDTFLSEPSDSMVFVVSVWNYPSQIDMSKPEVNLKDGFSGMLSALPGSEVRDMKMSNMNDFQTLEFLVENEDIFFQGKLIIVYNTLYQVFTVYKNTEDMTKNYDHFINSFKLINPAKRKLPSSGESKGEETAAPKKMNV